MRAAIYVRQSQDRLGDEAAVSRQRQDCLTLIQQRGWTLIGEHVDNDRSAAGRKPRPGFDALLKSVEAGEIEAIVSWSLDRLTRNRRDQLRLVETCEPKRTVIAIVRGSDLDLSTPAGRLSADILASVARSEIEVKADRQRRQQEQAAEQGRRVGGKRPLGYEADGMTVRESEAEMVRRAYQDVLAGVPLGQIARDWNAAGLYDGKRRSTTVRVVLLNPRYAGLRAYKGEVVANAQWPGLVPVETFEAVKAILLDSGRFSGGVRVSQRLLTGIALCGVCLPALTTIQAGGARNHQPIYRCRSHRHLARRVEPVDRWVTIVLLERLSKPDAADLLEDRQRPDVNGLREQAAAIRSRLKTIATEFADDDMASLPEFRAATQRLRERLHATEAQLADAGRVDLLGPLVKSSDIQATWDGMGRARQRRVIDMLMTVTLYGAGRGKRYFDPETVRIEPR